MAKEKHSHPGEHIVPTTDAERIEYIGIKVLSEDERMALEEIAKHYHVKVKRKIKNDTSIVVHVKRHGPEAKPGEQDERRIKYTIHLRLQAPMKHFEAEGFDFDIKAAAHQAFGAMVSELEHAFHDEGGVASKLLGRR